MPIKTMYICTLQLEQTNPVRKESCAQCTHAYPHEHTDFCDGWYCPNSIKYSESPNDEHMFCRPIVDKKVWLKDMKDMKF